ncbi:ATP-dependent RNA helicase dbp7 [Taphrina deformans PYCC 5710]|uniref:ATP-dependent RNA helicase n=1 Tax=Taphrina deformans (strain PYCC 5710 / ATCC 11124 / CBS 356.35 / IMI 108563 / JCM 9778 / NBRC 8474) TaxID=1097556 RepID=R4XC14_TAPDE|nr:ATP-dependent RNA helicase dbp7 [Taphrina deformans PYCC 5710]|eukprot:CCG81921.1 ATP-dependent RNA helicase dbp7 [Taphrina deformans PYCC 5710]
MEDGMLLNLTSAPVTAIKKKLSGGRWTDRLKHNKKETRRVHKTIPRTEPARDVIDSDASTAGISAAHNGHAGEDSTPVKQTYNPELKRKRPTKDSASNNREKRQQGEDKSLEVEEQTERSAGQVVSSLFDFHDPLPVMAPTAKVDAQKSMIRPSNVPLNDSSTFEAVGIIPELITTMADKLQVTKPTIIQKRALAVLTKTSKDVFIKAETGSGKTLAYLLPILNRLCQLPAGMQSREKGCYALIIAPTRELAQQIYTVLDQLLNSRKARWIVGVLLIGGEKKKSEKARLRKGANIVIATPGRLKDHLESTKVLDVSAIRWVILDEGDRLMDLGFENTIIEILDTIKNREGRRLVADALPDRRVTVICSATAKDNVTKLGEQSLRDAVFIEGRAADLTADRTQTGTVAPAQLKQEYLVVPTKLRLVTLVASLKDAFTGPKACQKVIVFLSCGDTVDWHFSALSRPAEESETSTPSREQPSSIASAPLLAGGLLIHKLHGSLQQQVRTQTLRSFATCEEPAVLLCTDVASRGLDLQVDRVIQYDPPFSVDDYTHRIGRTARAGRSGRALLFTLKSETGYIDLIQSTLSCTLAETNVKFLLKSGFGKEFEDAATEWQLSFEKWTNQARNIERAKVAFTSHVRAYATHISSERKCFPIHGLQLGHVAKSFGLRDAPSTIGKNLPKVRPVKGARGTDEERLQKDESRRPTDIQMRMRRSIAAQSQASEFNLM